MSPTVLGAILALSGLFCSAGGVCDWDFFMQGRGARGIVFIMGRPAARVFYVIFGLVIAAIGVGILAGLIPMNADGR